MSMRSWIRNLFSARSPRPYRKAKSRRPERARLGLEQLEDRRMPAIISPASFTAGDHEVNNLTLTADADWLTYNEAVPHIAYHAPGAFNPEFLKGLKVSFTGDENNHLTQVVLSGTVNGPVEGLVIGGYEELLVVTTVLGDGTAEGGGTIEADVTASLTGELEAAGTLIPGEPSTPGNFDDSSHQVDIEWSLLDAIRRLPDATAIVPLSPVSVGHLLAIPTEIGSLYALKAGLGAPPDAGSLFALEGILAGLGISGAIAASSGDVTVDVGDMNDKVDLSAFNHTATVKLGDGNDTLIMGLGNTNVQGGNGDDTFIHTLSATNTTQTFDGGPGTDVLAINGTVGDDFFTLSMSGPDLVVQYNEPGGSVSVVKTVYRDIANNSIESIAISGGLGSDTFVIDDSGGPIPVRLDLGGGGGGDPTTGPGPDSTGENTIILKGDPGVPILSNKVDFGSVPTFGGRQEVKIGTVTQVIVFDGFDSNSEFFQDELPGPMTIESNYVASSITIGGSTESPDPANPEFAAIVVGINGPIKFRNKTSLAYKAGTGDDTILIDAAALSKALPNLTSFVLDANSGSDSVVVEGEPSATLGLQIHGGTGDDALSGDADLYGDDGDDELSGGDGDNLLDGGPGDDLLEGGGGSDSYIGGEDFDTILISGDRRNNQIEVTQATATTLVRTVNGVSNTDLLPDADVEEVRIEAGAGDDLIKVRVADSLGATPDQSLRFDVYGGSANADSDRLVVVDDGPGNTVLHSQAPDERSGKVVVGALAPVVYQEIEYVNITPLDPVTGGTGEDGKGALVDVVPDPYESNNTLRTATYIGANLTTNISLSISPPGNTAFGIPGDEDWFRFVAKETGVIDFQVYFTQIDALANGGTGLPGGGDINIQVYDASGHLIAGSLSTDSDERITIPVVRNTTYYLRVFGATAEVVNACGLSAINTPAPLPFQVDLPGGNDTGRGNGDNVTFTATPTFDIYLDDDRLEEFLNLDLQADLEFDVQVFDNGVLLGQATFAGPSPGVGNNSRWTFTPAAGQLQEGENVITAAVLIRDLTSPQLTARGTFSAPLHVTLDTTAPAAPTAPDLLPSADTGTFSDDNVTRITTPAFQGTAEANTQIRIRANGVIVGTGTVGTDLSDGVAGNGLGRWEITTAALADGAYQITVEAEDQAGNISVLSNSLTIWIDTTRPNTPHFDLVDASDTGRDNEDDVTQDNTPTLTSTVDDLYVIGSNPFPSDIRYRIYDRTGTGPEVILVESFTALGGNLSTQAFFTDTLATLADGVHNLRLEVEDRAGNLADTRLTVTVDTTAPAAPTIAIDPSTTDTGVAGYPATFTDRVTSATAPGFVGTAEADAIVRLFASGTPGGLAVALPGDGNRAFPNGQWNQAGVQDLNNPSYFPRDGVRVITATAEDLAGNVSAAGSLEIFLDTQGPQVTSVGITGKPGFDLFDPKPSTAGPTPRVDSLTISLRDLPNRAAGFLYEAILAGVAANPGLYVLRGDNNGVIAVSQVIVTNDPPVANQPATATIELRFAAPLPDDRYTLTLAGTLVDPAGNALDGENNGAQPLETPSFPTGDGQPGGSFTARFTVDSAPEIGTYSFGAAYVDINGNGTFDPYGDDQAHRDIAFAFGSRGDQLFAGNFAPAGATTASGFDKLAAFGQIGGNTGPYRFLLDFDHDGVADLNVTSLVNGNGAVAVAGNFAAGHPGDEVGLFNGQKWFLDSNGNNVLGDAGDVVLQGNMQGMPIIGDFDGDGKDDLAAYKDGIFSFDLAANGLTGNAEATINFGFFGPFEQPVAADLNLDGTDDIGLFCPERNGPPPGETAEWFWLVSTGTPVAGTVNTLNHAFKPTPFGNDRFFQFGDELAKPLVGNFDPPVGAGGGVVHPLPEAGNVGNSPNVASIPAVVDATPVVSPSAAPFVRIVKKGRRFRAEPMDRSTGQVRGILGRFRTPVQVSYRDVNLDGVLDVILREKQGKRSRTRIFNGLDLTPISPLARQ
jgi:hypothetical protein